MKERAIEYFVKSWTLIPSAGCVFEVTVNDELVFSKKQLKRHAEKGEIHEAIMKALYKVRPADFKLPEN